MLVEVLFWGPCRTLAATDRAALDVPDGADVATLRRTLAERFEPLEPALPTVRIAVNQSFVADDTVLESGDEVALIPPVSGG